MSLAVLSAGFQTTVQDCGRFGLRRFGVAPAGALDSAALRILNLLVGNQESAAGLEIVSGRVRLRFGDDRLLAWTGGDFDVGLDALSIPELHAARVFAGRVCEISPRHGRAWLAISGGIDVPEMLGSRSTDLRARFGGLGGRALRDGDELPLARPDTIALRIAEQMIDSVVADWSGPQSPIMTAREDARPPGHEPREPTTLRIIPGKNWSEKTGAKFLAAKFRVALNSDRMGLRLESPPIECENASELVSEPVAPGTIQLPRGGLPIVLLADCQTIGGYPKIAHVITIDLTRAAQLQPMDEVRFELTSLEEAQDLLRKREHDIDLFRAGLKARFG